MMKNFIHKRMQTLAYLSLAALLIGWLGNWHWFAELFSHFVPYYAVILALAALLSPQKWERTLFAAFALALTFWLAQPFPRFQAASPTHSMIWYNVHLNNPNPTAEIKQILHMQPEIIALGEMNISDLRWQPLRETYPHMCGHEEYSPFSLVIYTRNPLKKCNIFYQDDIPYIRAQLADDTAIYALHPPPPITADLARTRLAYLQAAAQKIAQENKVIIVGDLNATPFSPVYRQFVRDAHIQAALPYFVPTWLPFGLHIDHILQRNVPIVTAQALAWGESDHRALWVKW